jgi:chitin disaccharide deacetylase
MARLLIVNADDYGLTSGVCRAIIKGHRDGIVTSTSALAIGPAFTASASALDDVPDLGVGVHIAVVGEDPPLLSAAEIPTLVDRRGRLDLSWRRFLRRAFTKRVDVADIEREATAQLEAVSGALQARALTHLDSHQHLHLWPPFGRLLVELARRRDIPAARVTRSAGRSVKGRAVNRFANRFATTASAAGLRVTDAFAGFDEGGTLAIDELVRTIDALGATGAVTAELGLHPGEHGDTELDRYEWGYRWGDELDALTAPAARAAVERNGFTLGSYAALGTTR